MRISQISIKGFKTLDDVTFDPGQVNIFIGANGSGKTTILEAVGLLSAALTDRIDNNSMNRKGIRLSVPRLYKSNFSDLSRVSPTIAFGVKWEYAGDAYSYAVNLNVPNEKDAAMRDTWRYHSEHIEKNNVGLGGRSGASQAVYDPYVSLFLQETDVSLSTARDAVSKLKDYAIYQPNTQTLRGTQVDPYQTNPLGLCGGRLAETLDELLQKNEDGEWHLGDLPLDNVLELVEWASDIRVTVPKKSSINSSVPTTRQVIEFQDRFLRKDSPFTAYDASEGALYVLFLLCLALHPNSPSVFGVDSFDHAMHPRLAQAATRLFCETLMENGKTAFVTTHNPLVLDGLNLLDDRIRLFTVNKSHKTGHTSLERIQITEQLLDKGFSLSRLWVEGRLGGVPNLL